MPLSISSPAANLASPGPIGATTPDVVTANRLEAKSGSGTDLLIRSSAGVDKITVYAAGNDIELSGSVRIASGGGIYTGALAGDITFNQGKVTFKRAGSNNVVNILNPPTTAAGLVSGDIYSNLGILTIVP